jgi:hypothetical protein
MHRRKSKLAAEHDFDFPIIHSVGISKARRSKRQKITNREKGLRVEDSFT